MEKEIFDLTYSEDLYKITTPMTVVLGQEWTNLSADDRVLLGKILGSVKQNLNSVRIITTKTPEASSFTAGSKVLCFGVSLSPPIPSYETSAVAGSTFLQADALSALDDVKKKNLWTAMKQAFLLK